MPVEGNYMGHLRLKLACIVKRHDWRETTSPYGPYQRCRHCYAEKPLRSEHGKLSRAA